MICTVIHFETGEPVYIHSKLDYTTLNDLDDYYTALGKEILEVVEMEAEPNLIKYTVPA